MNPVRVRIDPPLDGPLIRSMKGYAAEEHTPELEADAPDLHCPWTPTPDGSELVHLGSLPHKNDAAWLDYLTGLFLAPMRRKLVNVTTNQ